MGLVGEKHKPKDSTLKCTIGRSNSITPMQIVLANSVVEAITKAAKFQLFMPSRLYGCLFFFLSTSSDGVEGSFFSSDSATTLD